MSDQPKPTGAMIQITYGQLRDLVAGYCGSSALGDLYALADAPAEQTPVVGGEPDFWAWLEQSYRGGSDSEEAIFTKYNMEIAFSAGRGVMFSENRLLKARIAELEAQQGEPVAYVDSSCLRNLRVSGFESYSALLHRDQANITSSQRLPLYLAQPPAKVLLPERMEIPEPSPDYQARLGWNACLDESAKLNPSP